ncbi:MULTISPECIES: hypothetical protein [unclassified Acidovorax]|uniref:hypothetical protein n=1 Tax=unclassified Acidovorax TaxID=2684926 RepID=UPI0028831DFF|nr:MULTISPECIES: hypothetical protein [unclassified Acidovorax]
MTTIVPALVVIFVLAYAPARSFLGIAGPGDPLPILMFLGIPLAAHLVFRLALRARCAQCGGHTKFKGAIPSRYVCSRCGSSYKTQMGPVKLEHRD